MNRLFPALSLYEFLRIIIPGAYLILIISDLSAIYSIKLKLFENESNNLIYSLITMFLLGLLVYSFDFPKLLKYFQAELPSNKIHNKHPELDLQQVTNSYFTFYNKLTGEEKLKTEKYSGFFHLAINMLILSFLLFIISIINCLLGYMSSFQILNFAIFCISLIISINIYRKRLKSAFLRHLKAYYKSVEYNELNG